MLKKSGAVLLAMLYIVTVLCFVLNLGFGGNQTSSVNTAYCGMNKPAGRCCLKMKVKNAQQADETSLLSRFFGFELPRLPSGSQSYTPQQPSSLEKYFDKEPSDKPEQNIASFIRNCIFRL